MPRKLYKVKLKGMQGRSVGVNYGISYVVAWTTDKAYEMVRKYLNDRNIGFTKDRVLESIELIAEDYEYTETGTMLFIEDLKNG